MSEVAGSTPTELTLPGRETRDLRQRHAELRGLRKNLLGDREQIAVRLAQVASRLELAPRVEAALEVLSEELFGKLAHTLETHLTQALQEVLEQPILLKVKRDFKRGAATMKLYIERDGQEEDILRGQGGSVANVLSVGLRLLALVTLDPKQHRRCLILDEQDCWLAPELVPRLVRLVSDAARTLGFQVILISHHDLASFEPYANLILRFMPSDRGVQVERVFECPAVNAV